MRLLGRLLLNIGTALLMVPFAIITLQFAVGMSLWKTGYDLVSITATIYFLAFIGTLVAMLKGFKRPIWWPICTGLILSAGVLIMVILTVGMPPWLALFNSF